MSEKASYKELQAELDDILDKLRGSDLDIDEAVSLYERGMGITQELEKYLKQAENKITKLQAKFDQKA